DLDLLADQALRGAAGERDTASVDVGVVEHDAAPAAAEQQRFDGGRTAGGRGRARDARSPRGATGCVCDRARRASTGGAFFRGRFFGCRCSGGRERAIYAFGLTARVSADQAEVVSRRWREVGDGRIDGDRDEAGAGDRAALQYASVGGGLTELESARCDGRAIR